MRENVTIWSDVVRLGRLAVKRFKLMRHPDRLRIEPFEPNRGRLHDGQCWGEADGRIGIRLHRVGRPTQPVKRATIMATLAHELAHMKFMEHGAKHGELTRQIVAWFKDQGQPVSHIIHSASVLSGWALRDRKRPAYKKAWKRAKPRRTQ